MGKSTRSHVPLAWTPLWFWRGMVACTVVFLMACGGASQTSEVLAPAEPNLTSQPSNQVTVLGQTATFSVQAMGLAPFTYQWRKDGVPIPAATAKDYITPAATKADDGTLYSVVLTNRLGSVTSQSALLRVQWAPIITAQPVDQSVVEGQPASFSVTADGNPLALTFQWQKNQTDIPGATAAAYTLAAAAAADSGATYRCLVTNAVGSVVSQTATLSVTSAPTPPVITGFSANPNVLTLGQSTTLSWVASGAVTLSLDNGLGGVTGLSSQTVTPPATGTYTYTLTATNALGSTQANVQVVVSALPIHALTVLSGTGTTGSPAASGLYPQGTVVNYSYALQAGYQNLQVTLDGGPTVAIGTVTMDGDHTLAVTAQITTHTLTATAGPHGSINPPGTTVVNHGGNQTYAITPDPGYQVADLLVDGASVGALASYAFPNVTTDHFISATFSALPGQPLAVTLGAGTSGTPAATASYAVGTVVPYNYTLSAGYQNLLVQLDGNPVSASGTVTMTVPHVLVVSAQPITHTITATSGANGSVTPTGATSVLEGSSQTYAIVPNTGFVVADVLVDSVSIGAQASYTFPNILADHTISATFQVQTFTLTTLAGVNGSITPPGPLVVNYNDSQSFNIIPDAGYQIATVKVDGILQGSIQATYNFTNIQSNRSLEATFSPLPTHLVTVNLGAGTTGTPSATAPVIHGTTVNYTYSLLPGFKNLSVMLDASAVPASGSLVVNGTHTFNISAAIATYTITASAGSNGQINPPGATTLNYGLSQTYTMSPDPGFGVLDVLVDGVSQGPLLTYTFSSLSADHLISVTFAPLPTVLLTVIHGLGVDSVPSVTSSYAQGTSVHYTCSITLPLEYQGLIVTVDGVSSGVNGDIVMNGTHTLSVSASPRTYTLTASAGAHGSISPLGVTTVGYHGSQTYTIAPNAGYRILSVLVDGLNVGTPSTWTLSNIESDSVIVANFTALPTFTLTVNLGSGTSGTVATSTRYQGESVPYSFAPLPGYQNLQVTLDGSAAAATGSLTMNAAHTLASTATVIAPNAELALPVSVHPGDTWMKASAPIQAGMAYAWSEVNGDGTGTIASGLAGSTIDFTAGTTGHFDIHSDVANPTPTHATASRTVTVQTGTWLVKNGGLSTAANGRASALLPSGRVLVAGGLGSDNVPSAAAEIFDPATGFWFPTGNLGAARKGPAATLLADGTVLVSGGIGGAGDMGSAETYNPASGAWSSTGSLATARSGHTSTRLTSNKVLVVGGDVNGDPSNPLASAELFDPTGGAWVAAGSMTTARTGHTATLLGNGKVLVVGGRDGAGLNAGPELYDPAGSWSAAGSMVTGRSGHSALLLPSGKILILGGLDASNVPVMNAELFDPGTGLWLATGSLNTARSGCSATLLANGKVLVAGGTGASGALASAEIYDPASGTWVPTGSLATARTTPAAALLQDGTVLVAGGSAADPLGSTEIFDPAAGTWSSLGSLGTARISSTATLLADGTTLTVGGRQGSTALASALLYNATARTWTPTASLSTARYGHTATRLGTKVLVTGGQTAAAGFTVSCELYDEATGLWTATGSLTTARANHSATLLPGGKVLVAGGSDASSQFASAEIYDPGTGTWSATGTLNAARANHSATLLPGGKVLVAGGYDGSGALQSAELFDPTGGTWTLTAGSLGTARSAHSATLLQDGTVLVAGGTGAGTLQTTEAFDISGGGTWTAKGNLGTARLGHSATLLADGTVLVVGGGNGSFSALSTVETYNPGLGTWTLAPGSLNTARAGHTATFLNDGTVMVAFGAKGDVITEIYKP